MDSNCERISIIQRLDTFFPFDPLTLQRSREYIDPLYIEWEGSFEEDRSESGSDISGLQEISMGSFSSFKTMSLEDVMMSTSIG